MVKDAGTRVRNSVRNVEDALVEGALLTVFVVFLFLNALGDRRLLQDWRFRSLPSRHSSPSGHAASRSIRCRCSACRSLSES